MSKRTAQCACGQLRAACDGEPVSVSLCHCRACQRRTGSAFGIAAFFEHSAVKTSGNSATYTRASDSGHEVTFHFCPDCGASVYWLPSRMPDLVAVAAGAFADPEFPTPTKSVYKEHRKHWLGTGEF